MQRLRSEVSINLGCPVWKDNDHRIYSHLVLLQLWKVITSEFQVRHPENEEHRLLAATNKSLVEMIGLASYSTSVAEAGMESNLLG